MRIIQPYGRESAGIHEAAAGALGGLRSLIAGGAAAQPATKTDVDAVLDRATAYVQNYERRARRRRHRGSVVQQASDGRLRTQRVPPLPICCWCARRVATAGCRSATCSS